MSTRVEDIDGGAVEDFNFYRTLQCGVDRPITETLLASWVRASYATGDDELIAGVDPFETRLSREVETAQRCVQLRLDEGQGWRLPTAPGKSADEEEAFGRQRHKVDQARLKHQLEVLYYERGGANMDSAYVDTAFPALGVASDAGESAEHKNGGADEGLCAADVHDLAPTTSPAQAMSMGIGRQWD